MKKIILIMGLPGSGKTTIAEQLTNKLKDLGYTVNWYNADTVREQLNDWDFSYEGRMRQAKTMRKYSENHYEGYVIIDMIAPLPEFIEEINPNILIWMDTIAKGQFPDTNAMFVPPENYNFRVIEQNADKWSTQIVNSLTNNYIDVILL